jgi:hypothetical protein
LRKPKQYDVKKVSKLLREKGMKYLSLNNASVQDTFAKRQADKRNATKRLSPTGQFHRLAFRYLRMEMEIVKSNIGGLKLHAQ